MLERRYCYVTDIEGETNFKHSRLQHDMSAKTMDKQHIRTFLFKYYFTFKCYCSRITFRVVTTERPIRSETAFAGK